MERTILHSDMNCFYASVEMLHHPEHEGKPLAVGGDPEARHGIILTANYIAKRQGVKTGMALWQAKQACPDLVIMPVRMDLYLRFSRMANEIYAEYTDRTERFGCDETWCDVTESVSIKGDGMKIAKEISDRIKHELGVTVSIGVSWNKIYAKLGSDYKKPDAITEFNRENYKQLIWPLPASDLLCVGRSTTKKLQNLGITTIGQIADTPVSILEEHLGKMGIIISSFARGDDNSPVRVQGYGAPIKSIGNSVTAPRDLLCEEDVKLIFLALCESVSARLRENGFLARVIGITIRDNGLFHFTRQIKIQTPTDLTDEIMKYAMQLFRANYNWAQPIRSLGVVGADLVTADYPVQLSLFESQAMREKRAKMDLAVDEIRRRYGYYSIRRAVAYQDMSLSQIDAKGDHVVYPVSFFR